MDEDNKLSTPLLADEHEEEPSAVAPEIATADGLTVDTEGDPSSSSPSNFYDAQSHVWPSNLANQPRRNSYMDDLILQRQQAMKNLFSELSLGIDDTAVSSTLFATARHESLDEEGGGSPTAISTTARKSLQENDSEFVVKLQHFLAKLPVAGAAALRNNIPSMEIRLVDLSYKVPTSNEEWGKNKIRTLYNTSPLYAIKKLYQGIRSKIVIGEGSEVQANMLQTNVLTKVNLVLKPSKMYLVLGPPLSGKTSLLKAIAGLLPQVRGCAGAHCHKLYIYSPPSLLISLFQFFHFQICRVTSHVNLTIHHPPHPKSISRVKSSITI